MFNLLMGIILAGFVFSLSSVGGFRDAWSRNHWNTDLLKVALHSASIPEPDGGKSLEQFERMPVGRIDTSRRLFHLGRAAEELGDQRAAILHYERALASQDFTDLDLYFQMALSNRLGHLLFEQKMYSEAIPVLQQNIALQDKNRPIYAGLMVQAYWDLAESVYAQAGDQHAYEEYMLQAIGLSPSNTGLYEALMEHYLGWNSFEKAEALDNNWRAVAPASVMPIFYSGRIYQLKGDCEKAQFHYEEALGVEPQHFLSHFWLAMCDNQLGDLDSAIREFRRAINLAPSEWWIYRHLGYTLIKRGEYVEAQNVLMKGVSLNPEDGWTQQLIEEAKRLRGQDGP
jgi:tetratricopeptide (TPR) repeat protein